MHYSRTLGAGEAAHLLGMRCVMLTELTACTRRARGKGRCGDRQCENRCYNEQGVSFLTQCSLASLGRAAPDRTTNSYPYSQD